MDEAESAARLLDRARKARQPHQDEFCGDIVQPRIELAVREAMPTSGQP
jgi:hypothetical protein